MGTTTWTAHISGMHCGSCAMNIDSALEELDGVIDAHTDYRSNTLTLRVKAEFSTNLENEKKVREIVAGLGYKMEKVER
ncbi:MAG TPA: heavy metal transporter [Candidatus Pacebacteria bacterium]|nr:heavy metal transporter [Candidatus Paceibacterota bacterium]HAX01661.1 heavy metal transporter [Candidatus Paceibacterota bacterium]